MPDVRHLRRSRGLTLVDLALLTGIPARTLGAIECGFAALDARSRAQLAVVYGVSAERLWSVEPEASAIPHLDVSSLPWWAAPAALTAVAVTVTLGVGEAVQRIPLPRAHSAAEAVHPATTNAENVVHAAQPSQPSQPSQPVRRRTLAVAIKQRLAASATDTAVAVARTSVLPQESARSSGPSNAESDLHHKSMPPVVASVHRANSPSSAPAAPAVAVAPAAAPAAPAPAPATDPAPAPAPAVAVEPAPAAAAVEPAPQVPLAPYGCPIRTPNRAVITQGYGVGTHAPAETWGALDFGVDSNGDGIAEPAATIGAEIVATSSGIAHVFPMSWPGGNFVRIVNGVSGWSTAYGHLDTIAVQNGQAVTVGMVIGTVGETGMAYGPHLHYEVWHNGVNVDPSPLVNCGN